MHWYRKRLLVYCCKKIDLKNRLGLDVHFCNGWIEKHALDNNWRDVKGRFPKAAFFEK